MANQPLYICINDHANQAWGQRLIVIQTCVWSVFFLQRVPFDRKKYFLRKEVPFKCQKYLFILFQEEIPFLGGKKYLFSERNIFLLKKVPFYRKKYLSSGRITFFGKKYLFSERSNFLQKEVTFYRKKYLSSSTERSNFLKIEVTFYRKK